MTNTTRIGSIDTVDATRTHHRDATVRELDDGTIEYFVGDSARSRDGYATLPSDLVARVRWNAAGPEQIRHGSFGPIVWAADGSTRVATQHDLNTLEVGADLTADEESEIEE